jgi:hypothetical protein
VFLLVGLVLVYNIIDCPWRVFLLVFAGTTEAVEELTKVRWKRPLMNLQQLAYVKSSSKKFFGR